MTPDPRFLNQSKAFWAHVRSISESFGYTVRGKGSVKVPTLKDVVATLKKLELDPSHIATTGGEPTAFGRVLLDYFKHRADVLNRVVEPQLMHAHEAEEIFSELKRRYAPPEHLLPMNKQKGKKRKPAYLTGIVNMTIHAHAGDVGFDHDPRTLTTVTADGAPLRTLARRVDGAFPAVVNPVAVWEIKEYYHTTTFGSRVADGIYESLLDGMELEELREHEGVDVLHYLMLDAYYTWWECGRSYLCRVIDMLHMGYLDEVLFGREVSERLPDLVRQWAAMVEDRKREKVKTGGDEEPKPEGQIS